MVMALPTVLCWLTLLFCPHQHVSAQPQLCFQPKSLSGLRQGHWGSVSGWLDLKFLTLAVPLVATLNTITITVTTVIPLSLGGTCRDLVADEGMDA